MECSKSGVDVLHHYTFTFDYASHHIYTTVLIHFIAAWESAAQALCCVRLFNEGAETCHVSQSTVQFLGCSLKFVKGYRGNMNLIHQINGVLRESGMANGGFC